MSLFIELTILTIAIIHYYKLKQLRNIVTLQGEKSKRRDKAYSVSKNIELENVKLKGLEEENETGDEEFKGSVFDSNGNNVNGVWNDPRSRK